MRWSIACASALIMCGCGGAESPLIGSTVNPAAQDEGVAALPDQAELEAHSRVRVRERCGEGCVLRLRGRGQVSLTLGRQGQASVADEGQLLEEFRSSAGATQHLTEWSRRWRGSWTEGKGRLALRLERESVECSRTKSDGTKDVPCAVESMTLRCRPVDVELERPFSVSERSLVCRAPRVAKNEPLVPLPWVFALEHPVVARDRGDASSPVRSYVYAEEQAEEDAKDGG